MSKDEFWYWLRGSIRSFTMWFATLVALTPIWWPEVHPMLAELLGSDSRATKTLTTMMAITIVWLRVRGPAQTIPERGGKPLQGASSNELPPNA